MKKMKFLLFTILFFCLSLAAISTAYAGDIQLVVDGSTLNNLSSPPVIRDDFTMVPARDVFEELGALVTWNPAMQLVYIEFHEYNVLLQIGSNVAHLNNSPIMMDVAPAIISERTMIPLRFAAENLGFLVDWDPLTRVVYIDTPTPAVSDLTNMPPVIGAPATPPPAEDSSIPGKELIVPAQDISAAPLVNMNFPATTVTAVNLISDTRQAIDITTSSEIGHVQVDLLPDNRLIIDFLDAEMSTTATEFNPAVVSNFRQARIAQFQVTPRMITRVVVELENGVSYSLTMSEDRRTLSVDFERNVITELGHRREGGADYITILQKRRRCRLHHHHRDEAACVKRVASV